MPEMPALRMMASSLGRVVRSFWERARTEWRVVRLTCSGWKEIRKGELEDEDSGWEA